MIKKNLKSLILEELKNYTKGLHQAKVGDKVHIGKEGIRSKWYDEVSKVEDNRVTVKGGDIFNLDGRIYRGKSLNFQKTYNKNKTVSANLITQKEFDQSYKNIKIDFLRNSDFKKLDIKDILKIIDTVPNYKQANTLNKSRFK